MSEIFELDAWCFNLTKSTKPSDTAFGDIAKVELIMGGGNPRGRNTTSDRLGMTCQTSTNDWMSAVGARERVGRAACASEGMIPNRLVGVTCKYMTNAFRDQDECSTKFGGRA